MTHALHELNRSSEMNPQVRGQIIDEVRNTVEELRTQDATPEAAAEVVEATEHLEEDIRLGRISLRELFALMEAATVTRNPKAQAIAEKALVSKFPDKEDADPEIRKINERSRREFTHAMQSAMAYSSETTPPPFGRFLTDAEALTDEELGEDFDEMINLSSWTAREQRGELNIDQQRELDALRHRIKERKELAAKGVLNDEAFDDAVAFDPFADDED